MERSYLSIVLGDCYGPGKHPMTGKIRTKYHMASVCMKEAGLRVFVKGMVWLLKKTYSRDKRSKTMNPTFDPLL